jgi:secreted trypsin-like serine protease
MSSFHKFFQYFCFFVFTGCAPSSDLGSGVSVFGGRTAILDNETANRELARSVVRIIIVSNANVGYCSGTLVEPDAVLTAAHCFDGYDSFDQVGVKVGISYKGSISYEFATNVAINPFFDQSKGNLDARGGGSDYAVLKLRKPLQNGKSLRLATQEPPVESLLVAAGYGLKVVGDLESPDTSGMRPEDAAAKASSFVKEKTNDVHLKITSMRLSKVQLGHTFTIRYDNIDGATMSGDSGGPLLYNGEIVGVVRSGRDWKEYIDYDYNRVDYSRRSGGTTFASAIPQREWIKRLIESAASGKKLSSGPASAPGKQTARNP